MKNFDVKYTITGTAGSFSTTETIRAKNSKDAEVALVEDRYGFTDCPEWNAVAKSIRDDLTIDSVREV